VILVTVSNRMRLAHMEREFETALPLKKPRVDRLVMIGKESLMHALRRIFSLVVVIGISTSLFGQSSSARLTGTITDSTGAVVPGATVTLTDLGTQRAVSVQSDGEGNYVIPALPPGNY